MAGGKPGFVGAEAPNPGLGVDAHGARLHLFDPRKDCLRGHRRPEGEEFVQTHRIEPSRHRGVGGKQRLHLAGKHEASGVFGDVERTHSEGIARQNQLAAFAIPQADGPLAVEASERLGAPLFVGVHDHFGVAAGLELVAAPDEFLAQLHVVEDLAVERDPQRAALVRERLLARRQIDDRQPGVGKTGVAIAVDPELVRTAVAERASHHAELFELGWGRGGAAQHHARDAAHVSRAPRTLPRPAMAARADSAWCGASGRCPCRRARPVRR